MPVDNVPARSVMAEARRAAEAAAKACVPVPMLVGSPSTPLGSDLDPSKPVYFVAGGVCGFANVTVRPARGKFVTHCKKAGVGRLSYYGGWQVSSWEFAPSTRYNQSMQVAEAAASAAAAVLRSHGLNAYVESRMD